MSMSINRKKTLKIVFQAMAWVLVLAFATHPELRLLVPLLDSMGLELLIGLAGLQFLDLYRERISPHAAHIAKQWLYPAIVEFVDASNLPAFRKSSHFLWGFMLTASGILGTALALKLAAFHQTARSMGAA